MMTVDSVIAPEMIAAEIAAIEDLLVHYEDWRALSQLEVRERSGDLPASIATSGIKTLLLEKLAANPLFLRRQALLKELERLDAQARANAAANLDEGDDLTRIRGIDVRLERRLNTLGVRSYAQIAQWTPADVQYVSSTLGLGDLIASQSWIEQAAMLGPVLQRAPVTERFAAPPSAGQQPAPVASQPEAAPPAVKPAVEAPTPVPEQAAAPPRPSAVPAKSVPSAPMPTNASAAKAELPRAPVGMQDSVAAAAVAAAVAAAAAVKTTGLPSRPAEAPARPSGPSQEAPPATKPQPAQAEIKSGQDAALGVEAKAAAGEALKGDAKPQVAAGASPQPSAVPAQASVPPPPAAAQKADSPQARLEPAAAAGHAEYPPLKPASPLRAFSYVAGEPHQPPGIEASGLRPAMPLPAHRYGGAVHEPAHDLSALRDVMPPRPKPASAYQPAPEMLKAVEAAKAVPGVAAGGAAGVASTAPARQEPAKSEPVAASATPRNEPDAARPAPAAPVKTEGQSADKRAGEILEHSLPPLPLTPSKPADIRVPPPLPAAAPSTPSPSPLLAPAKPMAPPPTPPAPSQAQLAAAAAAAASAAAAAATSAARKADGAGPPAAVVAAQVTAIAPREEQMLAAAAARQPAPVTAAVPTPPPLPPSPQAVGPKAIVIDEGVPSRVAAPEARVTIRRAEETISNPVVKVPGATDVHLPRRPAEKFDGTSYAAYHSEVEEASVQIVRRGAAGASAASVRAAALAAAAPAPGAVPSSSPGAQSAAEAAARAAAALNATAQAPRPSAPPPQAAPEPLLQGAPPAPPAAKTGSEKAAATMGRFLKALTGQ